MYVIVTVNVPSDITKIACNLKAPIVVNTDSNKAAQLIVEDDYKVHFPIYDIIKGKKERRPVMGRLFYVVIVFVL